MKKTILPFLSLILIFVGTTNNKDYRKVWLKLTVKPKYGQTPFPYINGVSMGGLRSILTTVSSMVPLKEGKNQLVIFNGGVFPEYKWLPSFMSTSRFLTCYFRLIYHDLGINDIYKFTNIKCKDGDDKNVRFSKSCNFRKTLENPSTSIETKCFNISISF
jgi:hypothetical protein